ncbi:MAG: DNA repair protein RadA [Bacteroidales bacterium]|nr:DNA repair protein RadA [Bacteroidales bacterium]
MAKAQSVFFCQNCGVQSPKWIGRCPSCGEWNTYVEEIIKKETPRESSMGDIKSTKKNAPTSIEKISKSSEERMDTGTAELNRVLGGGLVAGSLVLIGGEPGIGKSTLMLQVALRFENRKILYVTGEESDQQIKMRADRIGYGNPDCLILTETNTQNIFRFLEQLEPDVLVIDSIQTLYTDRIDSSPGSISQVRECAAELQRYAKLTDTPVILIGHITKDGMLAGPKVLEHMVDTVLQFEGDRHYEFRILRSVKNRYGSTSELGIFEMTDKGLREISNPSEILISQRDEALSGVAVAATIEGQRPMLVETQALVGSAAYGTPQRSATGFDAKRLNMLLAVLEKRAGFKLGVKDVFLNIAGGIRVDDPAIDLAIISSVMSSNADLPIPQHYCFAGEVGLSGEIRAVNRIEQRVAEADKLGFEKVFISSYARKNIDQKKYKAEIVFVKKIEDLIKALFG